MPGIQKYLSRPAQRRLQAFCANRRAFWSLIIFVSVFCLTLLAEFIANDQPLLVKYKDKFYFPVFKTYTEQEFGGDFPTPADYRDSFIADNINRNGYIIFPPLPYSFNTVDYDLETPTPSAPAQNHLLGTDDEGRDILSRIIYGLRISVIFALYANSKIS